jgi:hypothetical protein
MGLIQEVIAVVWGGRKAATGMATPRNAEEAAWSEYHSTWEMDPPPEPRDVFLAGYRAGQEQQQ